MYYIIMDYTKVPSDQVIEQTAQALEANNFETIIVNSREEAKDKVLSLVPKGAEIFTGTSVTLDTLGITKELNESGNYDAVKPKLMKMDRETQNRQMQRLGAAPEYTFGSVHAVTEDGHVLIASNSGSQLPGYAYGADHVVWVVGAQKIVKDTQEGIKRIYEYVLPLESERAHKAYGVERSFVSKLLIYNREPKPNRVTIIIIKERIGF